MAILVTGGAGYIGSHTVVELMSAGKDVVVVDDFSNSRPDVMDRVAQIVGKRPKLYQANILDKAALRDIFQKEKIDAVIHFAAFKAVGESVEKPLKYYHNNIGGLISVLEVMTEFKVKKIVFSSSATVYGAINQPPFTEDMPVGTATNPYGSTKIMNEQILQDVYTSDSDWSVMLLRYFNPIGAHKSGLIGEDPNGIPNNIMPYITQVALGKLPKLHIFGDDYDTPDGTGVRDYIHVVDLAQGHVKAVDYLENHTGVQKVNLGTGEGYSVLQLVNTFKRVNNIDVPYQIDGRRPGDIATCYANCDYAKKLLDWTAQHDLADMCRDSWRWQQYCGK